MCSACALQVRTAVTRALVRLFENDMLGALLEDTPAQQDAYNRSVSEWADAMVKVRGLGGSAPLLPSDPPPLE